MKVRIDRDKCQGMAYCLSVAPTVFKLDEENKAVLLEVASVDAETLHEAAESCPLDAIILEDDDGNQIYPED